MVLTMALGLFRAPRDCGFGRDGDGRLWWVMRLWRSFGRAGERAGAPWIGASAGN